MTITPTIAEVHEHFSQWDSLLSDRRWLPDTLVGSILYAVWQAVKAAQAPCVWTEDDWRCKWDSECGQQYSFINGNPTSKGMRFCPFCGHPLQIAPAVAAASESASESGQAPAFEEVA
jgi:hypothetical protein